MRVFRCIIMGFIWLLCAGCANKAKQKAAFVGGCNHSHELPPLELTATHQEWLAGASTTPRTALDYYLLLPSSNFSIMPSSRERRVTYIEASTLTDDFLHASKWFECDGGGFEVTLKLYRSASRNYVVVKTSELVTVYDDGRPSEGDPTVNLVYPTLWRYSGSSWIREPEAALPRIQPESVLAQYRRYKAAEEVSISPDDFVSVDYVLSPGASEIILMGRGNYLSKVSEYGRLRWMGGSFRLAK